MRVIFCVLATSALLTSLAIAEPLALHPRGRLDAGGLASSEGAARGYAAAERSNLGGGFIEAIFSGLSGAAAPEPRQAPRTQPNDPRYQPAYEPTERAEPARPAPDPRYRKQIVAYNGLEPPGTIIIDTRERFLYLVEERGRAVRYGVGVGRPGFTWAGVHQVSAKREWPDWRPPDEMLRRRPDLPHFMAGGPENPLGARALYLGSSLYRIHGSNEPWTIGTQVSSGCIRMRNEDVMDLYDRVKLGTKVVVI